MAGERPHISAPFDAAKISVSTLADSLRAGNSDLLRAYFAPEKSPAPRIVWSPDAKDYGSSIIHSFAEVCDLIGREDGTILDENFSIEAFDGLDRWMQVVRREGDTFRYIHYGTEIRDHYGQDMTGHTTDDFDSHISVFFGALYRAAVVRRERVLSEHEPRLHVFVRAWRRLIVPLVANENDVTGFVAVNIPDNELRAGLEMIVDPVIVTNRDREVQYANSAAHQFFRITPGENQKLRQAIGLSLGEVTPPEVLLIRREVIERLELVEHKSGLMDRVALSISAAEHRGQAYYVLHVRPVDRG